MIKTALLGLALVAGANACIDGAGYHWTTENYADPSDGNYHIFEYTVDDSYRDKKGLVGEVEFNLQQALSHWTLYLDQTCGAETIGTCSHCGGTDDTCVTEDSESVCNKADGLIFKCGTDEWVKNYDNDTVAIRVPQENILLYTGGNVTVQSKSGNQEDAGCPSCVMDGPVCGPRPELAETSTTSIIPGTPSCTNNCGQGGGDPHFKTWTGLKFDYHGECDLVLIDNPGFANGLGLRFHSRTTRVGYFSYFERMALQIGDDVLEFANDVNNFWLNGKINKADKITVGGFDVWLTKRAVSIRLSNAGYHKSKAKIDFYEYINGMPYFNVDGGGTDLFKGSLGMLGDWETGRMLARDGVTENTDPTAHALEWQVRPGTDPMLFKDIRAPVYPAQCVPPQKMLGKRLGYSSMLAAAKKACSVKFVGDKQNCIFDVMATRSLNAIEPVENIDANDMDVKK